MSKGARTPWPIRLALTAFPRAFREAHAAEMEEDFAEAVSKCDTSFERVRLSVVTAADLIVSGVKERRAARATGRTHGEGDGRHWGQGFAVLDPTVRDLRQAVRALARRPGFSLLALATLALGIGATTAIFTVVDGVLLRRLPYPEPDRIVRVFELSSTGNRNKVTDPNFADLRERNRSLEALAQFRALTRSISGGTGPVRVTVAAVSSEFFRAIGTHPTIGRSFVSEERQIGAAPSVIVGHGFWQRYLAGQADLSAIALWINDQSVRVVGVMPPGFDFPDGAELWTPREPDRESGRTAHNNDAIGRLADGVSLERATQDVRAIARDLLEEHGEGTNMVDATLVPLHETVVGDARPALLLLFGGAAFLLLIACANVVNLLLARAASRQRELAVRLALGAGRDRLARVFLTESLLLSLGGGVLGVLLAAGGVNLMLALPVDNLPRAEGIRLNAGVLAFALAVSVLTAAAVGLTAAWRGAGDGVRDALGGSRGATSGRASERVRGALVVSQLGLTIVLLIGAGLLARSMQRALNVDPGFRTQGAVVMSIAPRRTDSSSSGPPGGAALVQSLVERASTIPGVEEVGAVSTVPLTGGGPSGSFYILNHPEEASDLEVWQDPERIGYAQFRIASEAYFRAMAIPLLRGRLFGSGDGPDTRHVAVISESLAKAQWPGEDPIGKFVYFGNMDGDPRAFTIVGIVSDIREESLEAEPLPTFYGYYRQRSIYRNTGGFSIVMSGEGGATGVVSAARRILAELNPNLPAEFRTLEQIYAATLAERRFGLLLVTAFAGTALVLALMGVYGVISFAVAQRTREIGIRMALGARARSVLRLVLKRGLLLAGTGAAIGIIGAFAATRLLASFLFGVTATDATTYIAVPLILIGAALIAAYIPARRAARVDPTLAMRTD